MTLIRVRFTPNGTPTPGKASFAARPDEDNRPITNGRDVLNGNPEWVDVPPEGAEIPVPPSQAGWHYAVRLKADGHTQQNTTVLVPDLDTIDFESLVRYNPKAGMAYEPDPDWWAHVNSIEAVGTIGVVNDNSNGLMSAALLDKLERSARSVLDYAALVTGDDWTPAFEAALEDTDRVFAPSGTYQIASLSIPTGGTLTGEPGTVLRVAAASGNAVTLSAESSLRHLKIDGNANAQTVNSQIIIHLTGPEARVEDVEIFDGHYKAVLLDQNAKHSRLTNCVVRDSGAIKSCDAFTIKASHVTVTNCHVLRQGNGHGFRTGRYFGDPEGDTTHVSIIGCSVYDSQHNAFTTELGSRYITIQGCTAGNVPQAIKGEDASDITVTGCVFRSISLSTAWNMQYVTRGNYQGNLLVDSAGGMLLGENAVCSGNTLLRVSQAPIEARDGAIITGNLVEDCALTAGDYQIRGGDNGPGLTISNNTIKNPSSPGNSTAIAVLGEYAVVTGNTLIGPAVRGIRIFGTVNHYVVTGNIMGAATTPLSDAGGTDKFVSGNI